MVRVLCVDDIPDICWIVRVLIESVPEKDMECVGTLTSADELAETSQRLKADIILLDATMPGKDPFVAMREVTELTADRVRTIVYSGHDGKAFCDRAVAAGAWGCVSKSDPPGMIVQAVREVAAGRLFFPNHFAAT